MDAICGLLGLKSPEDEILDVGRTKDQRQHEMAGQYGVGKNPRSW